MNFVFVTVPAPWQKSEINFDLSAGQYSQQVVENILVLMKRNSTFEFLYTYFISYKPDMKIFIPFLKFKN